MARQKKSKEKLSSYIGCHGRLRKAESSLLIQARTGKIGLRKFLFQVGVPGIQSPWCDCGNAEETVEHLAVGCVTHPVAQGLRKALGTADQILSKLRTGDKEKMAIKWLMKKLPEFRLATELPNS